jgi:glycosyltransferase involved in cell wall biosynthesis/O-antigen/teichoic acid export membrane protein
MITGGCLIASSMIANIFNFLYNAYLSRAVSVEEFGLISLIGSFLFLTSIPLGALSKTVIYHASFVFGEHGTFAKKFWVRLRRNAFLIAIGVTCLWLLAAPLLMSFFHTSSIDPFILFAPIWIAGTLEVVDRGFLTGSHRFLFIAFLVATEAFLKLFFAILFVFLGLTHYVYAAVSLSMIASVLMGWFFAARLESPKKVFKDSQTDVAFSKKFFTTSVLTKISGVTFLTVDVILAKHFLSPTEAGFYAFISMIGNIIYYLGELFGQFMTPIISRELGASVKGKQTFYILLGASSFASFGAYVMMCLFGFFTVPLLFGLKTLPILPYLSIYGISMLSYTIANNIASFYQIHKKNIFPITSAFFALVQVTGIFLFHQNIQDIVNVMAIVGFLYMLTMILFHFFVDRLDVICSNLLDFFELFFGRLKTTPRVSSKKRILIFNWRDTRHVWAGGAEVYIHEIAKRLKERGYKVTVFCGNDGHSPRNEVVDGVQIIRRGGFYTVYVWAFLYYVLRLHGLFDIVIDSENGIPFFTPLYVGVPVVGLVYHVHQEVFREHLAFPFSQLAMFLEGTLAPLIYRRVKMVAISPSSKSDMKKIGFKRAEKIIDVINPGIDLKKFSPRKKTELPTVVYLGRLKPYKSVDVIIKSMKVLSEKIPTLRFIIGGSGESRPALEKLVEKNNLNNVVEFAGRVSEEKRAELLATAWVVVQPSKIEGWGITAIEANASGTPVVAANVAGLRDSVQNPHTGFLVDWGDVDVFAKKIGEIIQDKKLRCKLEKGALDWSKNFSWEKTVDQVITVLDEVTAS